MRPRRSAVAVAVALDEMAPTDDAMDAMPSDEVGEQDEDDGEPLGRVCLACGGAGGGPEGCEHAEVAELSAPSRAVREAVARLKRAVAEHRAAARALRVLVLSEMARGRGDLRVALPPSREPLACGRCAVRDAEVVAAAAVAEAGGPGAVRAARRKRKTETEQQSLPFVGGPGRG